MKSSLYLIILLISSLVCACQHGYRLHINESYFREEQLSMYGSSAIAAAGADTILEIVGVYCQRKTFLDEYPIIRVCSAESGRTFIPLLAPLPCEDGALVRVLGEVVTRPYTYTRINKTYHYNYLRARDCTTLMATGEMTRTVDAEYESIKAEVQREITPDGSKLIFPPRPDWDIWYEGKERIFIFTTHFYDLMYAATLEFIINAHSREITDFYASEWFKGELRNSP